MAEVAPEPQGEEPEVEEPVAEAAPEPQDEEPEVEEPVAEAAPEPQGEEPEVEEPVAEAAPEPQGEEPEVEEPVADADEAEAAPEVIDISDAEPLSEVQAEVAEADDPEVSSASLVELASDVSAVTEDPEREVEEDDEPVAAEADQEEPEAEEEPRVTVKSVETSRAIDLVMEDAEDRGVLREGSRAARPASRLVGSMGSAGTPEQPLRVAIVGSGPSGFYAAGHLLKSKSHPDLDVQVDVYDRLPTPWGLVRGGVAPDHPNIKAVSRVYEKTAAHPEFRFYGNVELGRDITHADLHERYHAVIYAVGAQTDRRMGIPGEDLPGQLGRHGVRGLVQRPPRLPRPRVRPLLRARGGDRQRQRGRRRGPHARAHARRAGRHRRRRPRARGARRERASRRSWCSAGAARPRRRSPTPSCSSSAR